MLKKLLFFILLLSGYHLSAGCYIREYTYNVGDDESKLHARNITIILLKRNLIEELGVYIISQTDYNNIKNNINIDVQTKIISECITQFIIIDEKWNGYKYYIKAKICVNEDDLKKRLKKIEYKFTKLTIKETEKTEKKDLIFTWISTEVNYTFDSYTFVAEGGEIQNYYLLGLYYLFNIYFYEDILVFYSSYGFDFGVSFLNDKRINIDLYGRFGLLTNYAGLYVEPILKFNINIYNRFSFFINGSYKLYNDITGITNRKYYGIAVGFKIKI